MNLTEKHIVYVARKYEEAPIEEIKEAVKGHLTMPIALLNQVAKGDIVPPEMCEKASKDLWRVNELMGKLE